MKTPELPWPFAAEVERNKDLCATIAGELPALVTTAELEALELPDVDQVDE